MVQFTKDKITGKLIATPVSTSLFQTQRQKEKQKIQQEKYDQQVKKYNLQIQNIVSQVKPKLNNPDKYFSNIIDVGKFYDSLPIDVQKQIGTKSQVLANAQKKRETWLNYYKNKINYYDKQISKHWNNHSRRTEYEARRNATAEVYNKLKKSKGIFPNIDNINKYIATKGRIAGKEYDLKIQQKKHQQVINLTNKYQDSGKKPNTTSQVFFKAEMKNVLSGKKPDIQLFKKGVINASQYNLLVRAYETKINPVKFKNISDMEKAMGFANKNVIADPWTQEVAYKSYVNAYAKEYHKYNANIKPLSFKKDVKDFQELHKQILKTYNDLNKKPKIKSLTKTNTIQNNKYNYLIAKYGNKSKKDILKLSTKDYNLLTQKLNQKVVNKETMTPTEIKLYQKLPANKLNTDMIIKILATKPAETKRLLSSIGGEEWKFAKTMGKTSIGATLDFIKLLEKGGKKSLNVSYNLGKKAVKYGENIVKRANKEKTSTPKILTDDLIKVVLGTGKTLGKTTKTIGKTEQKVFNFFKKNKLKSFAIIGATSALLTLKYGNKFKKKVITPAMRNLKKDPAQTLGTLFGYLIGVEELAIGAVSKGGEISSKLISKLDKINPMVDFYVIKIGKGYEEHKGEYDLYELVFKGDIIEKDKGNIGVVRVKDFSLKDPTSWIDKLKGRKPGQFRKVYKLSEDSYLIKHVPSEYASTGIELSRAGKKELLSHVTPDSDWLNKAWKEKKEMTVIPKTEIDSLLKKRTKTGGIELGLFYAPTTEKEIKIGNKIFKKGTPQIYTYYSGWDDVSFADVIKKKAKVKLFKSLPGIFMKEQKIEGINPKLLKKTYNDLSQILAENPGKTVLSASTLKEVRTELEVIDTPFTKNVITKKYSIRMPDGQKFVIFSGRIKKLSQKEINQAIEDYIVNKLERINNIIKWKKDDSKYNSIKKITIKNELNNIETLKKKLPVSKTKVFDNEIDKITSKLDIKSTKLSKPEKEIINKLNKNLAKKEAKEYERLSKIYSGKNILQDTSKLKRYVSSLRKSIKKMSKPKKLSVKKTSKVKKPSVKKISKPKKLSVKKTSKVKKPSVKEISKPKKLSVKKTSKVKKPSVKKISKPKKLSVKKTSKVKKPSVKKISKPKKLSVKKTSKVKKPSVKEISKPKKLIKKKPYLRSPYKKTITSKSKKTNNKQIEIYNIIYRERKNKNKKYNSKTNPIILKRKNIKLPLNRAFNYGARLIDVSLSRSFTLVPIGKAKMKDSKKNQFLARKFRLASSKGKALKFVERTKYALDSKREKKKIKKLKNKK